MAIVSTIDMPMRWISGILFVCLLAPARGADAFGEANRYLQALKTPAGRTAFCERMGGPSTPHYSTVEWGRLVGDLLNRQRGDAAHGRAPWYKATDKKDEARRLGKVLELVSGLSAISFKESTKVNPKSGFLPPFIGVIDAQTQMLAYVKETGYADAKLGLSLERIGQAAREFVDHWAEPSKKMSPFKERDYVFHAGLVSREAAEARRRLYASSKRH
jgi:hypothetical protein